MDQQSVHAFTLTSPGKLREIITDIAVSLPSLIDGMKVTGGYLYQTKALWDTGATHCVVTKNTAKRLNLKPISIAEVSHADGKTMANVYLVDLHLPNNLVIQNLRVTECEDTTDNFGVIIGMDVITMGDFSITNVNNATTVSFRVPSIQTIDYVKEGNILQKNRYKDVGRNDPCPCGSGLKFKKCHGSDN